MPCVWISRPKRRAQPLATALSAGGISSLCHPALQISTIADEAALSEYFSDITRWSVSVFVSAAAAEIIGKRLPSTAAHLPALAVGSKTAEALPNAYRLLASPLEDGDSQALLRLPVWEETTDIAVLGGAAANGAPPSPLLCNTLARRSYTVLAVACYTRLPAAFDGTLVARGQAGGIDAAVAYSTDTLRFMLEMTAPDNDWLRCLPLFVIHDNIKRAALRLGFARVTVVSDAKMAQCICQALSSTVVS